MLHKPDVTGTLARYVVATRWEDCRGGAASGQALPGQPVRSGACGLPRRAGRDRAWLAREFSGGRQATVIGRAERIDALSAAFLNAAAANVHDFCDTHLRTVIHPTAPVAPAVLRLPSCAR